MDSKSSFGYDFYAYMRLLNISGFKNDDLVYVSESTVSLFLTLWGFSIDEIVKIVDKFENDTKKKKLEDFGKIFNRLVNNIIKNPSEVRQLVVQSTALAYLDREIMEKEVNVVRLLKDGLDLKQSEFEEFVAQGAAVANALNIFGESYKKHR